MFGGLLRRLFVEINGWVFEIKYDVAEYCRKVWLLEDPYNNYNEDESLSEITVTTPIRKVQKHVCPVLWM